MKQKYGIGLINLQYYLKKYKISFEVEDYSLSNFFLLIFFKDFSCWKANIYKFTHYSWNELKHINLDRCGINNYNWRNFIE